MIEFPPSLFPSWVSASPLQEDHQIPIYLCHQVCNIQNLSCTCWETQSLGFSLTSPQPCVSLPSCTCSWALGKKGAGPRLRPCTSCSSVGHGNHVMPWFSSVHPTPSGNELDLIVPLLADWKIGPEPYSCSASMPAAFQSDFIADKSRPMFLRTCVTLRLNNIYSVGCSEKAAIPLPPVCIQHLFGYPTTLCSLGFLLQGPSRSAHLPQAALFPPHLLWWEFILPEGVTRLQNSGRERAELQDKWGASGRSAPNFINLLDQDLLSK